MQEVVFTGLFFENPLTDNHCGTEVFLINADGAPLALEDYFSVW